MSRRVVVTGMGAITPIGNDVETFWNGLKEKKYDLAALEQICSGAVFICSTIPKAKNFRLFGNLKKVQICFFIAFVL